VAGQEDLSPRVAGDDVAGAGRGPADGVVGPADRDPLAVAHRGGAGRVGADAVALHLVAGGEEAVEVHARQGIPRDDVAGRARRPPRRLRRGAPRPRPPPVGPRPGGPAGPPRMGSPGPGFPRPLPPPRAWKWPEIPWPPAPAPPPIRLLCPEMISTPLTLPR